MNNIFKYLVVIVYSFVFAWVICDRFAAGFITTGVTGILFTVITLFFLRKYLNTHPFSHIFFILTFLLIISVPLSGKREENSFEKRELAGFPEFRFSNVWKFFFDYQKYFNDRFAFRNTSVQLISKIRLRTFNISTMPHLVDMGKNNWLFTAREDYVKDIATPFTEEQLDSVELHLEMISKYFEIRNIKFYFTMIPVKERIYPEYMSELHQVKMRHSKAEQLYNRIKNNPRINSIDVKDVLIEGKKDLPTYYTTDTHWNQFGAFLAYSKIINRIKEDFPEIEPSELSDYKIDTTITDAGDLQLMMGFRNEFHFKHLNLMPKSDIEPVVIDSTNEGVPKAWKYAIREMPSVKNDLKLLLVRDSFSEYLRIFLSRDFKRTEIAWTPVLPIAKIVQVQPDIVLQEMLEHFVMYTLKLPPEIESDTIFINKHFPQYLKSKN